MWAAVESIAPMIGCTPQRLLDWVKRNESECGAREVKELLRTNEILKLAKLGSMSRCNSQAHDPASSL